MNFYHFEFQGEKLARAVDNGFRNSDFSDIMEDAGKSDGIDLLFVKSHLSGNGACKGGYPFLVAGGVRVPDFHCQCHCLYGGAEHLLEGGRFFPDLFFQGNILVLKGIF
jgi:hypothetical protein